MTPTALLISALLLVAEASPYPRSAKYHADPDPLEYYGASYGLTRPHGFERRSLPSLWRYEGCFSESKGRLLRVSAYHSPVMTVRRCQALCQSDDALYAGLENGDECWCGNEFEGDGGKKLDDAECATPCQLGRERCGAAYRLSVYKRDVEHLREMVCGTGGGWGDAETSAAEASSSAVPSTSEALTSSANAPSTTTDVQTPSSINPPVASSAASPAVDSSSASTSAITPPTSEAAAPTTDASVVAPPTTTSAAPPSSSALVIDGTPWTLLGCAQDDDARVLTSFAVLDDPSMTTEKCLTICGEKGFPFCGLHRGFECFGGKALSEGTYYDEEACTANCVDGKGKCGSGCAYTVWTTHGPPAVSDEASSATSETSNAGSGINTPETSSIKPPVASTKLPETSSTHAPETSSVVPSVSRSTKAPESSKAPATSSIKVPETSTKAPETSSALPPVSSSVKAPETSSIESTVTSSKAPETSSKVPETSSAQASPASSVKAQETSSIKVPEAGSAQPPVTSSIQPPVPSSAQAPVTTSTKAPEPSSTLVPETSSSKAPEASSAAPSTSTPSSPTVTGGTSNTGGMNPNPPNLVSGHADPPPSKRDHKVWAHFMVGFTHAYMPQNWDVDIAAAKESGIDGFALNFGRDPWQPDQLKMAYDAAKRAGDFKLFLSFDMNSLECTTADNAKALRDFVKQFAKDPAQATWEGKVLVSTFAGQQCSFGVGGAEPNPDAWGAAFTEPLKAEGVNVFFVPSLFLPTPQQAGYAWLDGAFAWNSAWPGAENATTAITDETYLSALEPKGKLYMPALSPGFFAHYGPDSYNKNWIYASGDWLYCTRWEALIASRDRTPMLEIVTWNDFTESSYLAPYPNGASLDELSPQWVDGMDHQPLQALTAYYATAYKDGIYPDIEEDSLVLWSRPHPAGATATNDTVPRPKDADKAEDALYAVVLLKAPARVTIYSGVNSQTFDVQAGLSKIKIPSAPGSIGGWVEREGKKVTQYDSGGQFKYTDKPGKYNFNYFIGASREPKAIVKSFALAAKPPKSS